MQTYRTKQGDTVDSIAWRQYGMVNENILRTVLDANFGLAEYGATLPAGIEVTLPDIPAAVSPKQEIALWT